jgi:hypothetical protein
MRGRYCRASWNYKLEPKLVVASLVLSSMLISMFCFFGPPPGAVIDSDRPDHRVRFESLSEIMATLRACRL